MRRLLFLVGFFICTGAYANDLRGVLENNRGVRQFNAKKNVEAFDQFTGALSEMPFSGEVHANLGTTFLQNKEYAKALSEYREALRLSPGDSGAARRTRFYSHFNSAIALTADSKTDEALAEYQLALAENPDSVEAKTNIEILTRTNGQGGKGDSDPKDPKNQKNQKSGKGSDPKDPKDPKDQKDQKKQTEKPTPRPFKSEDLTQQDVGKILDELKRQEEAIRARMQNEKVKDAPVGKDW